MARSIGRASLFMHALIFSNHTLLQKEKYKKET